MKKILRQIRWAALLVVTAMSAQTYDYTRSTGTYTELTGATELSSDGFDHTSDYVLALPFNFEVYGTVYTSANVTTGVIAFDFANYEDILFPFQAEVKDNVTNTASVSYVVEGAEPNRIVKIQVKDAVLSMDNLGADYVNYQTWLYETSNVVAYHYGPGSVINPLSFDQDGPIIGVRQNGFTHKILTGADDDQDTTDLLDHFTNILANGTIYTFTPSAEAANSYAFSVTTATYAEITGTEITTDGFDDESAFPVTLPFDFVAYEHTYSAAIIGSTGIAFDAGDYRDLVIANGGPLEDNDENTASISYATEGAEPNRVFKIQYKDLAFTGDGDDEDYVNVQVWLYETSNVIELHYGASAVVNPDSYDGEAGPNIGIVHDGNDFFFLSGNASSPVQGVGPVTGTPVSGQVYVFTPTFTTGIFGPTATSSNEIQLYPNPGNGAFYLNSASINGQGTISVINTLGAPVFSSAWNGTLKQFEPRLESGVYTVKVEANGKSYFKKLVVE